MYELIAMEADAAAITQAVAAVIGLLLTFAGLLLVMHQIKKTTEQHADNLRVQEKLEQPYLYVDVRNEPSWQPTLAVIVENTGRTVGMNGKLTLDPPLVAQIMEGERIIREIDLPTLPPGRKIHFWLGGTAALLTEPEFPESTTATISFEGPYGKEVLTYSINLRLFSETGMSIHPLHPVTTVLKEIRDKIPSGPATLRMPNLPF